MIRKLQEQDRQQLIHYLADEPAINLFIIGDVESYGFDSDIQELWGAFHEEQLTGVLLRYENYFVPYYKDLSFDTSGFIDIIKNYPQASGISGKDVLVHPFKTIFSHQIIKETFFCELTSSEMLPPCSEHVHIAREEHAEELVSLLRQIEEFQDTNASVTSEKAVESMQRKIRDGSGRVYYIRENDEIVSIVQTTAENSLSAMIVGVATKETSRKKGYMSQILATVCHDVLQEGKSLCLFYDNPEAGKIYHRVGFQSIGMWTMIIKKQ